MTDNVIIVGAGPTGLMLACELRLAGVDVTLVERSAEPRRDAPGVAINATTIELLDQRGLMDELREGAIALPTEHFGFLFLQVDRMGRPHENTNLVLQGKLERRLERRADELGARIRRGLELIGLSYDAKGVRAEVQDADGGTEVIEGRYLVGCDGPDSAVRALAGIGFPGTDGVFHGIVGDIEIDHADLAPSQVGAYPHPSGGHYLGAPLEPGLLRVMTAEFGVEPPPADQPVGMAELRAATLRLTGDELKADKYRWLTRYPNANRNAERYSDGPVFLAGEAAHLHYPFNGQGISTGMQDATNLGWKLAAVLTGRVPAALLDSYHAERHPAGAAACANVYAQVSLCHPADHIAPLRRTVADLTEFDDVNRRLIETVTGLAVRYPGPEGAHPLVGRRLPHVPLSGAGEYGRVPELLRSGRGVLLDLTGSRHYEAEVAGLPIVTACAEPTPHIDAGTVLLRPDGHVAWAAGEDKDLDGLRTALTTWFGA